MKHLLYSILCLAVLSGCGKDNPVEEPRFEATGTYTITAVPVAGSVRMYTQAGEVNNAQLIRDFSQRKFAGLLYSPGVASPYLSGELAFNTNGTATLTTTSMQMGSSWVTTLICDVADQTPKTLQLRSQLSASYSTPTTSNACSNVVRDIRGISPVYACATLPPSTGLGSQCTFNPVYVLNLRNAQPSLALLSYIFSANTGGQSCSLGYRNDFNVFNTALPSRLKTGDTLVVQEAELPLVKK